jgi:hypothetical protein
MQGEVAQLIALVCHGNASLRGQQVPALFPDHVMFRYCACVRFVKFGKTLRGKHKEDPVADSPESWFAHLQSVDARGIRIWHQSSEDAPIEDRMSAAFVGGGGTWAMEAILPKNRSAFWLSQWEVGNREAPDRRIWQVTYGQVSQGTSPAAPAINLSEVADHLAANLSEIHAFAQQMEAHGFAECFSRALTCLNTPEAKLSRSKYEFAPPDVLAPGARCVLDACDYAWVFGGMGSWNDLYFGDDHHARYEQLSEQLYDAIIAGIVAATNTSYHDSVLTA